jgi:hypothetical protein
MRTSLGALVVALLTLFAIPERSWAWNAAGHRTITSIIFRRLPEDRRLDLAELLAHHPRFEEDFIKALPESLRNADPMTRAEWLLQQASVWPDIVRGGPAERKAFNRPLWHYLPRAFFLTEPDASFKATAESKMNSRLEPDGGTENPNLNGPQAFKANLEVLKSSTAPKAERAVALCWVLHIGQDLHQPCHTASLCLPRLFAEGDRGANSIKTKQQHNLHAVWDGPLGPNERFERCRDLAIVLLGEAPPESINEAVGDADAEILKWLDEGIRLEREAVYVSEVRDEVARAETTGSELPVINLSADYLRNVRSVSDRRFISAGVRLGNLMK